MIKSKDSTYQMLEGTVNPLSNNMAFDKVYEEDEEIKTSIKPRKALDIESQPPINHPTPLQQLKEKKRMKGQLFFGLSKRIFNLLKSWYRSHCHIPPGCIPYLEKIDNYFGCTEKGSNIELEVFSGIISFFSCAYILAVVPAQMSSAGYSRMKVASTISLWCGLGTILSGFITNTPLVVAPTTAVSIYYVSNLRSYDLTLHQGNMAIFYAGIMIISIAIFASFGRFISKIIPKEIQIALTCGIGLITILSGMDEIEMVVQGDYTLLSIGKITDEIVIAMSALIVIAIGVFYHSKYSYFLGLVWGSFVYWSYENRWPRHWLGQPILSVDHPVVSSINKNENAVILIFEIFVLILLTFVGLAKALCDLANITTSSSNTSIHNNNNNNDSNNSIPKGRYLLILIGIINLASGIMSGPPFMLSPESASGIKAGAKTGLSAVIAGLLFLGSIFFAPLFTIIPAAGTSPILMMVGMLLFQNVQFLDFASRYAMPSLLCLTLIPFSDSIIAGLGFGCVNYLLICLCTGDIRVWCKSLYWAVLSSVGIVAMGGVADNDLAIAEAAHGNGNGKANQGKGGSDLGDLEMGQSGHSSSGSDGGSDDGSSSNSSNHSCSSHSRGSRDDDGPSGQGPAGQLVSSGQGSRLSYHTAQKKQQFQHDEADCQDDSASVKAGRNNDSKKKKKTKKKLRFQEDVDTEEKKDKEEDEEEEVVVIVDRHSLQRQRQKQQLQQHDPRTLVNALTGANSSADDPTTAAGRVHHKKNKHKKSKLIMKMKAPGQLQQPHKQQHADQQHTTASSTVANTASAYALDDHDEDGSEEEEVELTQIDLSSRSLDPPQQERGIRLPPPPSSSAPSLAAIQPNATTASTAPSPFSMFTAWTSAAASNIVATFTSSQHGRLADDESQNVDHPTPPPAATGEDQAASAHLPSVVPSTPDKSKIESRVCVIEQLAYLTYSHIIPLDQLIIISIILMVQ